jgi:hypothetical protein
MRSAFAIADLIIARPYGAGAAAVMTKTTKTA